MLPSSILEVTNHEIKKRYMATATTQRGEKGKKIETTPAHKKRQQIV